MENHCIFGYQVWRWSRAFKNIWIDVGFHYIFVLSYKLLGRVTGKKDREGYNTAYSYTEAGDIKSIIYNDGKSVEYTYNSLRQLSQVKDALGTKNIEGDKFGRATKVVDYSKDEVSWKVWWEIKDRISWRK